MLDLNKDDQRYDLDALAVGLARCAERWVPEIFANGRIEGDELRLANIAGAAPRDQGSCVVYLTGEHAGEYYDFAVKQGGGPLATLKAGTGLGGRALLAKAAELVARCDGLAAKPNGRRKGSAEDHLAEAAFILAHCQPAVGSLVEVYFAARGLTLPATDDILFHPDLTDWQAKRGRPGMVARIRHPDGTPTGGVHRTYLRPDGSAKADDMRQAKMMLGPSDGGVVMLAPKGQHGVLGVAEGIETAAAAATMFAGVPVWAVLSAGGLRKFGAWLATDLHALRRLLIFADAGPVGESAAAELYAEAKAAGLDAEVYLPRGGDDLADDLAKGLAPAPVEPAGTGRRPLVRIAGGNLPAIVDDAEAALVASDPGLYQRGDFIVRPAPAVIPIADDRKIVGLRLVPVRANHLAERLTHWVDFQRFDLRSKKWLSIDCPPKIAATYLERVGAWRLRMLTGFTVCPTLRPDGSILDRPGWDESTGILYAPSGIDYPPIPVGPTKDDARAALDKLKSLIREFPFVDDASRSVSLSGMLTSAVRRSLPSAPLHAFDAPVAGAGKSKLADLCSMLASGHEAPVITQGANEEELEKRLAAILLAGDATINIDNCEEPLGGSFICQCLTQPIVKARILGKSQTPTVASNATFFSTGNNLAIIGDLVRRAIRGRLDPRCERPELRRFETPDPVLTLKRAWPEHLVAALTVLRAFDVAGRPSSGIPPGSFETWWGWVRGALVWLGQADPCDTIENIRAEDPRLTSLSVLLEQWHRVMGGDPTTVKQVIDRATDPIPRQGVDLNQNRREYVHPELRDALLNVAGNGGFVNERQLGQYLSREKLRIVNGLYIAQGEFRATWRVMKR
jgi:hypothetical protein